MERGFSFNKSLLVENLATKSLIAHKIDYDHMKVNNVSVEDVEICPTLHCSVKHAQKKNKVQYDRSLKQKQVQEEITAVNKEKTMLENVI